MRPILSFVLPVLCSLALAQAPPPQMPGNPLQPPTSVPGLPGLPAPGPPVKMNFEQALARARQYNLEFLNANLAALIAHEEAVQAKAALLPTGSWSHQFIYTQPNGTDTGVFIANNGPREYINQGQVHADVFNPTKLADYRASLAAAAAARAEAEVAARGLIAIVVENYYGVLAAQHKLANAQQNLREAQDFLSITQKQEASGEVAHVDTVKAEIQFQQRLLDVQNAQLALEKARIALGVLLFPAYGQPFTLADDLDAIKPLPALAEIQTMAVRNNPEIRAAEETVKQQTYTLRSARAGYYPSLGVDYFFGIDANQYALRDELGHNNLGSSAAAALTIPVWNWGATRSRIRAAEFRLQQTRNQLALVQRNLVGSLNMNYTEAVLASTQADTLRRMAVLAEENLRLTRLRYVAGESTAQEVVDAQAQLAASRDALADGMVRYRTAVANLQTITGMF